MICLFVRFSQSHFSSGIMKEYKFPKGFSCATLLVEQFVKILSLLSDLTRRGLMRNLLKFLKRDKSYSDIKDMDQYMLNCYLLLSWKPVKFGPRRVEIGIPRVELTFWVRISCNSTNNIFYFLSWFLIWSSEYLKFSINPLTIKWTVYFVIISNFDTFASMSLSTKCNSIHPQSLRKLLINPHYVRAQTARSFSATKRLGFLSPWTY